MITIDPCRRYPFYLMVCTEILHNLQTSQELGAHQLQTWEIEMTNLKWLRQALLGGAALSVLDSETYFGF
jgi:hypothetical protein